jgi:NCAIR mutase (PurE)-related protein
MIDGGINYLEVGLGVAGTVLAIGGLVSAPEVTVPVLVSYYYNLGCSWDLLYNGLKN